MMILNQPSGNVPAMNGSRPFSTLSSMTKIPEDLMPDPKGLGDFRKTVPSHFGISMYIYIFTYISIIYIYIIFFYI